MAEVSKEMADNYARKVFLPDSKRVKFLGKDIDMKPVPVSLAKELRLLSEKIEGQIATIRNAPENSTSNVAKLEVDAVDLYVDVAHKLLGHYGFGVDKASVEREATVPQLKLFIESQIEVQGEEDFLLQQLNRIMRVFFRPKQEKEVNTPS